MNHARRRLEYMCESVWDSVLGPGRAATEHFGA